MTGVGIRAIILKRTLSWIAVLSLCALIVTGAGRLPGAGGLASELRWLFARDGAARGEFNRASTMLHIAEVQRPGSAAAILDAVLSDTDERVVNAALILLVDLLEQDVDPQDDLRRLFMRWYASVDVDMKLTHLDAMLNAISKIGPELEELGLSDADLRWIVAGTLRRNAVIRLAANELAESRMPVFQLVRRKLEALDGLSMAASVRLPLRSLRMNDELAPLLDDSAAQVRWAVGRILVLSGDRRGLPALNDWLSDDPKAPRSAGKTLEQWFGPDWRKPFETEAVSP